MFKQEYLGTWTDPDPKAISTESIERLIEENINRFKNGLERYRNSPLFYSIINVLACGENPIFIIDKLLIEMDSLKQEILDLHLRQRIVTMVKKNVHE